MNPTRHDLAKTMAEKTDEQLLDMFAESWEWTPEALDAARAELRQRAVPLPPESAQQIALRPQKISRGLPPVLFWGVLLVLGGASGRFVLRGTNSSDALMVVGCGMVIWGLLRFYRRV